VLLWPLRRSTPEEVLLLLLLLLLLKLEIMGCVPLWLSSLLVSSLLVQLLLLLHLLLVGDVLLWWLLTSEQGDMCSSATKVRRCQRRKDVAVDR
jgi:hypothetical protein